MEKGKKKKKKGMENGHQAAQIQGHHPDHSQRTGPLETCRCMMVAAYSKVQKEKTFAMNSGRKANSELHSTLGGRGCGGGDGIQWELIHTKHLLCAS